MRYNNYLLTDRWMDGWIACYLDGYNKKFIN